VAHVTLILGGCRSGKSGYALKTANAAPAAQRIFIATSVPFDEEMQARVQRHRAERGPQWLTVEAPLHLPEAIAEHADADRVILADCLTLWVSNLLLELHDPAQVETRIRRLVEVLQSGAGSLLLVTNEVGCGVVPENKLARQFRDLAGSAHQAVAAVAERVVWVAAGIPLTLKP
jgi:adenosylcobinamide kinase/adenosylcobinamide-phosphate guanylyltransferase